MNKDPTRETASEARQARADAVAEVPERPALAPNIELVGEMQGTGFRDRQWLIQRDGQFIQVSELLYRVAEQANGERTLAEMAEGVTETTDWFVSDDAVRQLVGLKLIPMGFVVPAEGTDATRGVGVEKRRVRSPLSLTLRMRVIGPGVIEPITKVLQYLYAPPVLVPVLIAIVVAHGWLYLVHGVAQSFLEVLFTPGLMFVALVIVLVSGVFHEFGHAAALRYGGGKVRGMGAGFYLMYPAFYTDVTDSYRLGRWARVRTSLGGFYFHLIFALGMVGLYLVTGQEFLLIIVLVISLDIVYQCLPFVRFDGYWALADLTGVPDFFSQMGAFLRSMLPGVRWRGAKLPNLKPWVRTVFVAYVAVAVPVLALLLFFFVTRLPEIVGTMFEALYYQARTFNFALANADVLSAVASVSQAFLLFLQLLAIAYMVYGLGWMLISGTRKRAGNTPVRRALGAAFVVGVVALVAFFWAS